MTQANLNLDSWIARVQKGTSAKDVFVILDEFRVLDWSDNDRAAMAKAYVRVLQRVGAMAADNEQQPEEEKDDGPVWYEKM